MIVAKLHSRLPEIITSLPDEVDGALKEGMEAVAQGAQERVPVDSGALRDAIHVEQVEMGYAVVAGDSEAFYGHIVEHGGVRTPPRPFLIPAYESEHASMLDRVADALKDL